MNRIFLQKKLNKSLVKIEIVVKKINGVTENNPNELSVFYILHKMFSVILFFSDQQP